MTSLVNSNYVVSNSQWDQGEGEVTWCSGATGLTGIVSAANSLMGTNVGDDVGDAIVPLTNGNDVVDAGSGIAVRGR